MTPENDHILRCALVDWKNVDRIVTAMKYWSDEVSRDEKRMLRKDLLPALWEFAKERSEVDAI